MTFCKIVHNPCIVPDCAIYQAARSLTHAADEPLINTWRRLTPPPSTRPATRLATLILMPPRFLLRPALSLHLRGHRSRPGRPALRLGLEEFRKCRGIERLGVDGFLAQARFDIGR